MSGKKTTELQWTPKQLHAIRLLATELGKTLTEVAAEVGVTERTLRRWRQNPRFCSAVWEFSLQASRGRLGAVLTAMTQAACEKNVRAGELILNFHGKWSPKMKIESVRMVEEMPLCELLEKLPERTKGLVEAMIFDPNPNGEKPDV